MINKSENVKQMTISISPIKAFNDNYIWAVTAKGSHKLVLVDPGDAQPCIEYMKSNNLELAAILITHHHADHTGGIAALKKYSTTQNNELIVYGPANEKIADIDIKLLENDQIDIELSGHNQSNNITFSLNVLEVPGHTAGHIAYFNADLVFCGDTLFSGGCGRLFEGTPQQMFNSLEKLKALPSHTKVYCTHEYTLANLHFALATEPNNQDLIDYFNTVKTMRERDQISLPSSIGNERRINPFLRTDSAEVKTSVSDYNNKDISQPVDVFGALRSWKDNF